VPAGESPIALARAAAAAKAAAPTSKAPVMEEKPIVPTLKPLSDDEFAKLADALAQGKPAANADSNSFWDVTADETTAPAGDAAPAAKPADAASFWDTAVQEEEKKGDSKTMSLEEAAKLGLIPRK
jgi:hypothetical protein